MANSIISDVSDEIKEIGKDTVKTLAHEVKESGKVLFKSILNLDPNAKLSVEELAKKKSEDEQKKQELISQHRKMLKQLATPSSAPHESAFEHAQKEEQWKKQRQVELAKQKQMAQLPQMSAKPQRGSLLAHKKRKQNQTELAKSPGQ